MDIFTLKGTISVDATDAKNDIDAVKKAAEEAKTALDNLKNSANAAEEELDQVATAANNAETELGELKTASNGAESELDQLETAASGAAEELKDVDTYANQATAELKDLDTAADNAAEELKDIDTQGSKAKTALNQVGQYAVSTGTALDEKGTFSVGAAYAANMLWELTERAAEFALELGKTGLQFNATMEVAAAQFGTLLQTDIEGGKTFLEQVHQFAIDTPLGLQESVDAAVRLLTSGVNSEDVIDTLWMLGDLAQGDTARLARIAKAYADIMNKTKLMAQETNQLTENGVPIMGLLETYYESVNEGTDYTIAMLMEMREDGEISAADVHNALLMATLEGGDFYNAMANMMDTGAGQWEKYKDSVTVAMGALTSPLYELAKSETLPKLTELMNDLVQWAKENPEVLNNLSKALSDLAVNGLTLVTEGLTTFFEIWNSHRAEIDTLLVLLGAMSLKAHPAVGLALIAAGNLDIQQQIAENEDDLPSEETTTQNILDGMDASPELRAAAEKAEGTGGVIVLDDYEGSKAELLEYTLVQYGEALKRKNYGNAKYVSDNWGMFGSFFDRSGSVAALGASAITGEDVKSNSGRALELGLQLFALNEQVKAKTGENLFGFSFGDWYREHILGLTPFKSTLPDLAEERDKARESLIGTSGMDTYDTDQEAFLLESRYSLLGMPDGVVAEMQAMWDAYRAAKLGGYGFDTSDYERRIYNGLYPFYGQYIDDGDPIKDQVVKDQVNLDLATLLEYMARLSPHSEDLPANWFVYDHADDPWYNPGGGGGNPYDFPAPTSSADTATLIAAIQGLAQAYNPDAIAAAVEGAIIRGMSGVTIEQGNVVLNTGSLVGTLTPILNQRFGALMGRAARG